MTADSIFKILFDDTDILVIEKRKAFLSQRSDRGSKEGLYEFIARQQNEAIFPVHRLDREVLGLMVFAKNAQAAQGLSDDFKERKIHKAYWAWVHRRCEGKDKTLVHYLVKNEKKNFTTVYPNPTPGAKRAELQFTTLSADDQRSLLEVNLLTGRSHQIRAQLAKIGHPIIGDDRYSAKIPLREREAFAGLPIQLRAVSLSLRHPRTGENLSWKLDLQREDFFKDSK